MAKIERYCAPGVFDPLPFEVEAARADEREA